MSQICRTCLQKANITFKTSQQLGDFDEEGPVMIGKALKYCIKDIYLGLSVNTDICLECKENLKISYAFKKQCAKTDSIILNFLRNARCTGKSVDLYDVVTELNREQNFAAAESSLQVKTTTADDINLNTDDFHTFFQTHITDEKPIEVRESAPNTTVAKPKKPFKGGILNEYGKVANELIKKLKTSSTELLNPVVNVALERSKETVPTTTTTSNLCQISNVFSLNDISGNSKSNVGDITHMDTGEEPNFVNNILDIKEEPIDIDITDNPLNFPSFTPTDEDTLDASETSIFEKSYDSNVQGSSYDPNVQGSILEVNHPDQYVDIPDFVTINNFGFKELEELRLQQKINNEVKSKSVLKPLTDMPNNIILAPKDTIANGSYQGLKVVNLLSNLPDVLILEDGKRMVKCGNGYKIDNAQGQAQDDAQEPPKPKVTDIDIKMSDTDSSTEATPISIGPPRKRTKKNFLSVESKEFVLNLHTQEMQENPNLTSSEVERKVVDKAGISFSTVRNIVREYKTTHTLSAPNSAKKCKSIFDSIDKFDKNTIRKKVHEFFVRNKFPTMDKILKEINDECDLPNFKKSSFHTVLRKLNFRFEKQGKNSILMDRDEIVTWRKEYLTKMRTYRKENRKIYYLDEMWINAWHTNAKVSVDKSVTSGKEKRLNICHVGSEEGFVLDALWSFESNESEDCHEEINARSFESWFQTVLPKLDEHSVIVLDSSQHHSRKLEQTPTAASKKSDIQEWILTKNIPFEESIIIDYTKNRTKYIIDEMAKSQNRIVLRLPPYHGELNPLELIWADMKKYIATKNTFKFSTIKTLFDEALVTITPEKWKNCVQHVQKIEKKMWELDDIIKVQDEKLQGLPPPIYTADDSSGSLSE